MAELLNDGFDQPQEIDAATQAFPATVAKLTPQWMEIPIEFRSMNGRTPQNQFVTNWFFMGWPDDRSLTINPDVDPEKALKHLSTIMRSYALKHEHKEAAVAWLMSRWYGEIIENDEEDDTDV